MKKLITRCDQNGQILGIFPLKDILNQKDNSNAFAAASSTSKLFSQVSYTLPFLYILSQRSILQNPPLPAQSQSPVIDNTLEMHFSFTDNGQFKSIDSIHIQTFSSFEIDDIEGGSSLLHRIPALKCYLRRQDMVSELVEIHPLTNIKILKSIIRDLFEVRKESLIKIVIKGKELINENEILLPVISEKCIINFVVSDQSQKEDIGTRNVNVIVKEPASSTIMELHTNLLSNVSTISQQISNFFKISPQNLYLTYAGQILNRQSLLSSYNLVEGGVIYAINGQKYCRTIEWRDEPITLMKQNSLQNLVEVCSEYGKNKENNTRDTLPGSNKQVYESKGGQQKAQKSEQNVENAKVSDNYPNQHLQNSEKDRNFDHLTHQNEKQTQDETNKNENQQIPKNQSEVHQEFLSREFNLLNNFIPVQQAQNYSQSVQHLSSSTPQNQTIKQPLSQKQPIDRKNSTERYSIRIIEQNGKEWDFSVLILDCIDELIDKLVQKSGYQKDSLRLSKSGQIFEQFEIVYDVMDNGDTLNLIINDEVW